MEHFQQTRFWAEFKSRHGWEKNFFIIKDDSAEKTESCPASEKKNFLSVMTRRFDLRLKKFTIAYVPMKPEIPGGKNAAKELSSLAKKIIPFLPPDTVCIRFDPDVSFADLSEKKAFVKKSAPQKENGLSVKKSFSDIQPPDTVILDVTKTEEEILSEMKSKWRYNIKLAKKKNVRVEKFFGNEENFPEKFDAFFALFSVTGKRDGVQFHAKEYYTDLFSLAAKNSSGEKIKITLYLAEHEGDYLAGIITIFTEKEAVYLYGASGNSKRNLMPAYLLQWEAISDAKKEGCEIYDFYGCPPDDDKNHPMHGLYLFKTGFGGTLVHRAGSFDVVLKKTPYFFYCAAEKLRSVWHKKILKILIGR